MLFDHGESFLFGEVSRSVFTVVLSFIFSDYRSAVLDGIVFFFRNISLRMLIIIDDDLLEGYLSQGLFFCDNDNWLRSFDFFVLDNSFVFINHNNDFNVFVAVGLFVLVLFTFPLVLDLAVPSAPVSPDSVAVIAFFSKFWL